MLCLGTLNLKVTIIPLFLVLRYYFFHLLLTFHKSECRYYIDLLIWTICHTFSSILYSWNIFKCSIMTIIIKQRKTLNVLTGKYLFTQRVVNCCNALTLSAHAQEGHNSCPVCLFVFQSVMIWLLKINRWYRYELIQNKYLSLCQYF